MQDGKVYMAVLAASLFGVSIPVFADGRDQRDEATRADDDARLAVRVKATLLNSGLSVGLAKGMDIRVSSDEGVIYLTGLAGGDEKRRAEELALAVPGVREVRNNIEVLPFSHSLTH